MSNVNDEKLVDPETLDNYLRGDTSYSRVYGSLDADALPPELDRKVLAEARAAVAPRKGYAWQRVGPMLAVAATAVLTLSIVVRSGLETSTSKVERAAQDESLSLKEVASPEPAQSETEPATPSEATTPSIKLDAPPPTEIRDKIKRKAEQTRADETRRETDSIEAESTRTLAKSAQLDTEERASRQLSEKKELERFANSRARGVPVNPEPRIITPAPFPGVPSAASAPSDASKTAQAPTRNRPASPQAVQSGGGVTNELEEVVMTGSRVGSAQSRAVGPRGTIPPPATLSLSDRLAEQNYRENNPPRWLEHIRDLRQQGKQREADREWERFLKAHPNFTVDANDAARPRTPQR